MNKLKSFFNKLKIGLALGMKTADEELIHTNSAADDVSSGIHQQVTDKRVAKHLLKGEVTQEVEELRYRTYLVDRESKDFDFYSPVKAVRKDKIDNRKFNIDNSDCLEIITIQENKHIGDDVYDTLEKIDINKVETNNDGEVEYNLGKLKKDHNYTIKLGRNDWTTPRYRLEEYTKKLVCFYTNEEKTTARLDFYVTKYPNDKEYKSKGFVREIEKVKDNGMRTDIFDFDKTSFVTSHAYKIHDGISFKFRNVVFKDIIEYDGDYVVRFNADIVDGGTDFFDKYYNEKMAKNYEEKAEKMSCVNFDPYSTNEVRTYKCSICGKEIMYNLADIDAMQCTDEGVSTDITEYMDMEMSEQTFGKFVCKDCMEQHKLDLLKEYNETH